jgi:hypothetical protein
MTTLGRFVRVKRDGSSHPEVFREGNVPANQYLIDGIDFMKVSSSIRFGENR